MVSFFNPCFTVLVGAHSARFKLEPFNILNFLSASLLKQIETVFSRKAY